MGFVSPQLEYSGISDLASVSQKPQNFSARFLANNSVRKPARRLGVAN